MMNVQISANTQGITIGESLKILVKRTSSYVPIPLLQPSMTLTYMHPNLALGGDETTLNHV